jgi:hypothetical protein
MVDEVAPPSLKVLALHRLVRRLPEGAAPDCLARELPGALAAELADMARLMQGLLGSYAVTQLKITSNFQDDEGHLMPALLSEGVHRKTIHITQDVTEEGDKCWTIGQFIVYSQEKTLNAFSSSPAVSTSLTSGAQVCWSCGAPAMGRDYIDNGQLVLAGRHLGDSPFPSECGGAPRHTFSVDQRGDLVWRHTRDVMGLVDGAGEPVACDEVTTEITARRTLHAPHSLPSRPAITPQLEGAVTVPGHVPLTRALLATATDGHQRTLVGQRIITLVQALCPDPTLAGHFTSQLLWDLELLELWRMLQDRDRLGDAVAIMLKEHKMHG